MHSYIQQNLNGENINASARLHGIGYLAGLLLPILGWLATYYVPSIAVQPWAKWVCLAGILGGLATLLISYAEQTNSEVVITDHRLIGYVGDSFNESRFDINLSQIKTVNLSQSILGRLLDYGTITVTNGSDTKIVIPSVASPHAFRDRLVSTAHKKETHPLAA